MKILAIDIGAGTQDVLLFDSQKKVENCISFVLPTPSRFYAKKLKTIASHVYIHGDTIGGGALGRAILHHLQKGRSQPRSFQKDIIQIYLCGTGRKYNDDGTDGVGQGSTIPIRNKIASSLNDPSPSDGGG